MAKNTSFYINIGQGLSMLIGLPSIPTWKTKTRPKKALTGTFGFNIQTNSLEYWSGTAWYGAELVEDE